MYRKISFMKMLKSTGPRIDPCGTPPIFLSHSLNECPILQRWFLFVRELFMNEAAFKSRL